MTRRIAISLSIFAFSLVVLVAVLALSLERSGAQGAAIPPGPPAAHRPPAARRSAGVESRPFVPVDGRLVRVNSRPPLRAAAQRGAASRAREHGPRPALALRVADPPAPAAGVRRLRSLPAISNPFDGPAGALHLLVRHPAYVDGPLTGERTPWVLAHRRPLAVMVENYDPDSRPQTGLNAASLVFETVAEGGITRFMAVYLEHDAPLVGPVRSARVYFNAWANGLHAVLVHAGGNDDALAQLFHLPNVADLNEVAFEDANFVAHVPFFSRSPGRQMPHNLYTYPDRVRRYLASRHVALEGDFPDALPHRRPDAPPHRPYGGVLDLNFSDPSYAVEYRYDHAGNRYLRWMGGAPHVDAATGHQIAPSNVLVLLANIQPDPDGGVDNPGAVYVQCTGKNVAYLFRDGYRIEGTWHKAHGSSHLDLLDRHGRPFAFNPGQTWVEVLPANGSMTWSPGRR